ncbi:MAG: PASTA domain-containing protein [Bacteroidia bacterium]|nr:PASTA domain-containing protein [Bacteroidia bacterium]
MQNFLSFIKSKQFLMQLGLILLLIFLVFFVLNKWLTSYTGHGEYVKVPDFKGQKITALNDFIKDKDITYNIIDSVYAPKQEPGVVLRQDPDPETKVKHNRTIYLYVTCMVAPQIQMPKLIDRSERQARLIIETYGLRVGRFIDKAADCNGCVLSQSINGRAAVPGQSVKKGSVVDLEIGRKDNFSGSSTADSAANANNNQVPNFDQE